MTAPTQFLRRMRSVPEDSMRDALWLEKFAASDTELIPLFVILFQQLDQRTEAAQLAWHALLRVIVPLRGGPTALKLWAMARQAKMERLASLFTDPGPPQRHSEYSPPLSRDRDVTLGERRSWARRPERKIIERLLLDRDPRVISTLLSNPRIRQTDVLKIASRRPTDTAVLNAVFHHPRWGRHRGVMEALVYNPHTALDHAVGLVALLGRSERTAVAQSASLRPEVRAAGRAGRVVPTHVAPMNVS